MGWRLWQRQPSKELQGFQARVTQTLSFHLNIHTLKNRSAKKGGQAAQEQNYKSKTTSNAPFGTTNAPTDYSTNLRPKTGQQQQESTKKGGAAGAPTNMAQIQQKISAGESAKNSNTEELINKFRGKLVARGCRGIFSIGRLFRNMDDDNSKSINFPEFSKVCNEFRMDLPVSDVRLLFNYIDVNKNGEIDYDEFLRTVRGTMYDARKKWVTLAFKKLDKDGSGVVNLDDLRGSLFSPLNLHLTCF